jgi:hypothetical protein
MTSSVDGIAFTAGLLLGLGTGLLVALIAIRRPKW